MVNNFRIYFLLLSVTAFVSFVRNARGTAVVEDDMTIKEMKVLLRKQSKQLMELEKNVKFLKNQCSKRTCENDFRGEVKNEIHNIEKSKLVLFIIFLSNRKKC